MTDLPDGWTQTTLGELGSYLNGRAFKRAEWSDAGRPIIRIQNLTGTASSHNYFNGEVEDRYIVRTGDLLISWAATLGAYIWRGPEAVLNQHIFKVSSFIDTKFHYYLIEQGLSELLRQAHGSGMVHITRGKFDNTPVHLPPLVEQRRIVAALEDHLSRLDAAGAGADAARVRLAALRRRVLSDAVGGRLVPAGADDATKDLDRVQAARAPLTDDRRTPPSPGAIDSYLLPERWAWASLAELSYDFGYGTSTKCSHDATGLPVLRIPNVQRGEVDLSDIKNAVDAALDLSALFLRAGDILFVRTNGSRNLIGRAAVVREAIDGAFASYLIRFRLVPAVDPDWVALVISSPLWRRHLEFRAASSAGQYNLSTRILAPLGIPIPPKDEQQAILAQVRQSVESIDRLDKALKVSQPRSNHLRRALLAEALSGRLVDQDSGDEPAAELLARITAERASAKPTRRARSLRTPKREPAHSPSVTDGGTYQQEEFPL
jgi:type I restriction enzyme S subunit